MRLSTPRSSPTAWGVPFEQKIEVVHGDTDRVPYGIGSYGSRSLAVGGSAMKMSVDKVIEGKGRRIAAHLMEADPGDLRSSRMALSYRVHRHRPGPGHVQVRGHSRLQSDRVFRRTRSEPGLEETTYFDPPDFTFPYGSRICARSRSIPKPARSMSLHWRPSTISATSSTR